MASRRCSILLVLLCTGALTNPVAGAAEPIPPENRIAASTVGTIEAPADQPMLMPTDVTLDSRGRVFVADGANHRVLRFSSEGRFEQALAKFKEFALNRPVGLTVDAADQLWIADTGNHAMRIISPEGSLVRSIGPISVGQGGIASPTSVAVAADGRRAFVVDNARHRILVLKIESGKWTSLGEHGNGLGQLNWPFMICSGSKGDLFVSEVIAARVQRLGADQQWGGQIGQYGVELGKLYRPKGVASDGRGRLFVGDSTMGVIQVFQDSGRLEGVLTGPDGAPLRLAHPMGMRIDKQGRLYVVELRANRVAVISLKGPGK